MITPKKEKSNIFPCVQQFIEPYTKETNCLKITSLFHLNKSANYKCN